MMGAPVESLLLRLGADLGSLMVVKVTLLLYLAALVAFYFRHTSAALRSAIWGTTLAILFVLPFLSVALPSWQFLEIDLPGSVSIPANRVPGSPAVNPETTTIPRIGDIAGPGSSVGADSPAGPRAQGGALSDDAAPADGNPTRVMGIFAAMIVALWLGGCAILLLRLGVHSARAYGITRRARTEDQFDVSELIPTRIPFLEAGRPVRVVMSEEVSIPCSWGLWNPVVLLPASARKWPDGRTRSVLMHELAHMARRDHLMQLAVEIVRAVYWLHPLVWFAVSRYGMERELACDDFVLRHGTPRAEYASHLLQIARLQAASQASIGAVAMAGGPGLKERIGCIMNKRLDRTPVRLSNHLLAICGAVAIAVPLATMNLFGLRITFAGGKLEIPATLQLVDDLRNSGDSMVRRRAAWWLGEHEARSAAIELTRALRDQSADVRLAAAWALGEIKDRGAITSLAQSLNDLDPLVREMAALALGEIEDPSAVEPLTEAFDREDDLRPAVVWALGEIQGREAAEARQAAFRRWDRSPWTNDEVWTGVLDKRLPDSEDVPAVLNQLRSGDAGARRRAALNLGYLGTRHHFDSTQAVEEVVDALLEMLRDAEPSVLAAAVWSLDEINPSRIHRGLFSWHKASRHRHHDHQQDPEYQ